MDKETLSNYGWIVVLILISSVMLACATPFGNFLADAIKSASAGFWGANNGALNIIDNSDDGDTLTSVDDENKYQATTGSVIPMTGIYYVGVTSNKTGDYTGATAVYKEGDTFPQTVNDGDIFVFGDYEYRYNMHYYYSNFSGRWESEG